MASQIQSLGRGYRISRHRIRWCVQWFDECRIWRTNSTFRNRRDAEAWGDSEIIRVENALAARLTPQQLNLFPPPPNATLLDLVEQYVQVILSRGREKSYTDQVRGYLLTIIKLVGFTCPDQITPGKVQLAIGELRKPKPSGGGGLSIDTAKHYLGSFRSFCKHLADEGYSVRSIRGVKLPSSELDRRYTRGALTADQLELLINTAMSGPDWIGRKRTYTGPDRAMFYLFQAMAALRESATRKLQVWQLNLRSTTPGVMELAKQEKARKPRFVPLRTDDAARLREYLYGKTDTDLAFNVPPTDLCAEMIRFDLARAGIPAEDPPIVEADGTKRRTNVIDIHSLKCSYSTRLVEECNADDGALKELVGHSKPKITWDHYVKRSSQRAREVIERLKPLAISPLPPMPRTG